MQTVTASGRLAHVLLRKFRLYSEQDPKLFSSHQEYNNERYNNPENIGKALSMGQDLFGRTGITFERIDPRNNSYLPFYYEMLMPEERVSF